MFFSKYSKIEIDGDWFDVEDFAPATPDKIEEVQIPEALRPNLSAFFFKLERNEHILTFESYSESKSLSARAVEKYFKAALNRKAIVERFGHVEADIVKSFGEVERIVNLPSLKELRVIIRRPNSDDISGGLAEQIEERLQEQNGEEYEEVIRSRAGEGLVPSERTKQLALVGAENGEVTGKSMVNGATVYHTTEKKPEKIVDTYHKDDVSTSRMFVRLAERMVETIRKVRSPG